jgi:hypothetical protein
MVSGRGRSLPTLIFIIGIHDGYITNTITTSGKFHCDITGDAGVALGSLVGDRREGAEVNRRKYGNI